MFVSGIIAQSNPIEQARFYYHEGQYQQALKHFETGDLLDSAQDIFIKGHCYFHLRNLKMAESSFLAAKKAGYETAEMYFLMGQIKQAQMDYPQALFFYKKAFKKIPESDIENRDRILWTIKNTALAETLFFSKSKNLIQNLGTKINRISNETNPIGSPTFDGLIYFSSNANYFNNQGRYFPGKDLDLFQGFIRRNNVDSLSIFETALKSDLDDFVYDISDDGQGLIYVQGQNRKEIFWRSYNPDDNELISQKSFMSVIGESRILNFDMFQDSIYIFSSDKLRGYGGYDLYFTVRTTNGWLKPINLGPRINTINDELDPFLNKQGDRIYFSSNRIDGMGGFDVYCSVYSDIEKNWQKPKNILHPLNSSRDDLGFRISPTQHSIAYMYSNRLTDNYGGFDIYRVILDQGNTNEIANKAPIFISKHLDSNIMDPIYIETEEDIIIEDQPTDLMVDKDYPEEPDLVVETIDSSAIFNKIDQEAFVRDNIATVERIAREVFIKDSIATVERLAEEAAKEEERLITRETFVRDSIATTERIAREAFVKDSIATVERLAEEAAKEEERRIARETFVRDSIAVADKLSEREALRIKREAEVEEKRKRIAKEKIKQDSLAIIEQQEADALAEMHRVSDEAWKSKLEAKPLDFETIILSLGNPDATVIQAQPEEVDQIIDILTPNPHAIVEIEGFYPKKGRSKVYDLYNSLLLANELKDALIDRGIDPKKLIIKGHGYRLSDNSLAIIDDNQRRILVRILNRNKSGYIPNLSSLFSLQAKESNYYQKYAEKVGGLTFKVEAIKLRRMLANEAIDKYEDLILEQKGNEKNFAYLFGTYKNMDDAISMVDKLKGYNIKQPIIYPYLNGIRVSLEQSKFMEDLYPELKNYLRYLESE